jgi:protein involved in ribonucleotide reduction
VTENTKRFIEKLDVPALRIPLKAADAELFTVSEDFVLVTPTYGAGGVPKQVIKFLNLEQNRLQCKGVIGSGNRNFFENYAKAADTISAKLEVPVLYRFELAGTQDDIEKVTEGLYKFWQKSPTKVPST